MSSQPPRAATVLLKMCCSPAYLEDIEGDLHELFLRRAGRIGVARARRAYLLDVASVCVRQLAVRAAAGPRHGRLRVSPLGLVFVLLAVLGLSLSSDQPWSRPTGFIILCVLGVIEVATYAGAIIGIVRAWRRQSPRDQGRK
jgi:hypothetical protein